MGKVDNSLLILNRRGIFVGPKESDDDFFLRAGCRAININFSDRRSVALIEDTFGSSPDWIETIVQSKGLLPWEGAATWIEDNPGSGRSCHIQLKDSFLTRLYAKEEVEAHEMVHAMRLMFDESRFEEILAYRTSKNRFRRYFGPLFSTSKESKWFILLLAISWLFYGAEIVFDFNFLGESVLFSPLLLIGFAIIRLKTSQDIFSDALKNIRGAIQGSAKPLSVALRLTDREIELFARSAPSEICAFAKQQREQSLRWRQLCISYFELSL